MVCAIFCQIAQCHAPASIIYANELVTGLMALHPQNPGHMLVIPNQHFETINDQPELAAHLFFVGIRLARTLPEVVFNSSCTYVMHEGFDGLHLHLHLIPRHFNDGFDEGQRQPRILSSVQSAMGISRSILWMRAVRT